MNQGSFASLGFLTLRGAAIITVTYIGVTSVIQLFLSPTVITTINVVSDSNIPDCCQN